MDYYQTLGLKKEADITSIKKAYRKLAIKYHPDKQVGKAPEQIKLAEKKFKEISEAYSILSDPDKKKQYDMFGTVGNDNHNGFNQGGFRKGFKFKKDDAFKIFKNFFGNDQEQDFFSRQSFPQTATNFFMNGRPFFSNQECGHKFKKPKYNSMNVDFQISLKEFYTGVSKNLEISNSSRGTKCSVEVVIQPGMREGVKITYSDKIEGPPEYAPGDIILQLVEKNNSLAEFGFVRASNHCTDIKNGKPGSHNDLITICSDITISEAQKDGFERIVRHMDGRAIHIKSGPLKNSAQTLKIVGEGMPIRKKGKVIGKGDLLVLIIVNFNS